MSETGTRPPSGQPYDGPPANPWAGPASDTAPLDRSTTAPERPGGRRPGWAGVIGASVLAAALASGATLAGVAALNDDSAPAAPAASSPAPDAPVPTGDGSSPDWTAVAEAVAPSVVTIQVSSQDGSGQGSGVILDAEGNILTNNHVVTGAGDGASIGVVLSDGRVFGDVEVVGLDPTTDLAVLRITDPPADLVPASLGSSSDVIVGQEVMAVGNPLGLSDTVTTGIVSAVDRPVTTSEQQGPTDPFGGQGQGQATSEPVVTNAIQTDAAINPGNSGGALVDTTGDVIGINSSIASTSAESGSIGIGFAIPIDEAQRIADELLADGTAEHALLGVSLQDGVATADGTTLQGAEVGEVVAGSAAADAGIEVGDTIVAVESDGVAGAESLTAQVRERAPGTEVTLKVFRGDQSLEVPVVLGTRKN